MKTTHNVLFIGDIHGLPDWQELVKNGLWQHYEIVFLGDYVDSFVVKPVEQLRNLEDLCNFIRENKKNVTAILGNHDYAYIKDIDGITGKQYTLASEYKKIFMDNIDLFQMAWGHTNANTKKYTLATHAGLTQNFYNFFLKKERKLDEPLHEALNRLVDDVKLIWKVGSMRGGVGTPGPLWADYYEVIDDPYEGINQVFGHTPRVAPTLDHFGDDFIACIDSRGNKKVESMIIAL
jgi:predicted phosphodiesterase